MSIDRADKPLIGDRRFTEYSMKRIGYCITPAMLWRRRPAAAAAAAAAARCAAE
jgi:hypothetical protein